MRKPASNRDARTRGRFLGVLNF